MKPEQVLAGNGSDEVLDWILKVFCSPGIDRLAITPPTYGMYQVIADILGVGVYRFSLNRDFSFDPERFFDEVPADVKVLILCSPNNPTGNSINPEDILAAVNNWNGVVVVDEAYIEFSKNRSLVKKVDEYQNLVVTRTFSKALGRAGLRLGYVVADSTIIEYFRRVKMPYNLNSLTLENGIEAIRNFQEKSSETIGIIKERERVRRQLQGIDGVGKVFPSDANFVLFECNNARKVYNDLFSQGIVIRDRSSVSGLESCLRVSIGTKGENDRFLTALKACIQENQ
jgi:histidinol-phosphate aminotransferase